MCALTAPEVFDQDDTDGRVRVRDAAPPPALHGAVRRAVDMCPAHALTTTPG
jgi:ferredoxin